MSELLLIPGRFNGPRESGNGGYASGAVAVFLGGTATVSLRRPVPLDRPLQVSVDDRSAQLFDRDVLIAEGERATGFAPAVPEPVSVDEAREATTRYRGMPDGPFSHCFVCGLARDDSFGVCAGAVEGRDAVASPWIPPAWAADAGGRVEPEFVWAALDCPTYFAAYMHGELATGFLARMTARIDAPVMAGEEHVAIAWPIQVDGRKRQAGSAVLSAGGDVLAVAQVLLIEPRS